MPVSNVQRSKIEWNSLVIGIYMTDISMSIDDATKMILKSQAQLLQCMITMETTLGLMEYQQRMIAVSQTQYANAKSELAVLKVEKQHLTTNIEICKKIRDLKSDVNKSLAAPLEQEIVDEVLP